MCESADSASPRFCRVLTAPGRAAVAVVELRVPSVAAAEVFTACFRTKITGRVAEAPLNRILYGQWNGEDVVVVRTAEDRWEIQCHGGPVPVQAITDSITAVLPDLEDSRPPAARLFDDQPPLESMLSETLIRTQTARTASCVLAQQSGVLRHQLESLTLLPPEDARVLQGLQQLRHWSQFASHLTDSWRVLILGPPNVGKSSLVNVFLGFDRTIVHDEAGTTRDLIEATTILQGWPFVICDSAGLRRNTDDQLERAGMASVHAQAPNCDLILVVLDVTDSGEQFQSLLPTLPSEIPRLILLNKADCVTSEELKREISTLKLNDPSSSVLGTSAVRGDGVEAAMDAIVATVIPEIPPKRTPLPACQPLREMLKPLESAGTNPFDIGQILNEIRTLL